MIIPTIDLTEKGCATVSRDNLFITIKTAFGDIETSGWQCPRCKRCYAPSVESCGCEHQIKLEGSNPCPVYPNPYWYPMWYYLEPCGTGTGGWKSRYGITVSTPIIEPVVG